MIISARSPGADVIENGWNWLPTSPARNEKIWCSIESWKGRSCSFIASERKLTKTNWPGVYASGLARGSITTSVTYSSSRFAASTR